MASRSRQHLQIDVRTARRLISPAASSRAGRRHGQALARVARRRQACGPRCRDQTDRGEGRPDRHPSPPASALRATRSTRYTKGVNDDEIELLSVPARLRRSGREIRMVIYGTDSFAAKPDARLIKLLLRARRFNATLAQSEGVPFAALAEREGVSRSYFTRLVRLSYLAPDITEAILDGRQPPDLTTKKLLEHSRLPLAWHDQRTVLGFS